MKKHLLLLVMALLPMVASAYDAYIDGIYYNFDSGTKTATVTYKAMYQSDYSGEIVIPSVVKYEGVDYIVTSIDSHAFLECGQLYSVTIPNSVTAIGVGVFCGCTQLSSVTMSNKVTSIGSSTFMYCKCLTSLEIPNSVTSIGENAFWDCSSLTSLIVPNSVTTIEGRAFRGCSSLTSVSISSSVRSVGNFAFEGCNNLKSVYISDLAAWCSISFGDGGNPLSYAHHLLLNDEEITELIIPDGVKTISPKAFSDGSNFTSVVIPESVYNIGWNAFGGCSGLTSIIVDERNTTYDSRDHCNAIIETATNKLIIGCLTTNIPEEVTSIGDCAFYGCRELTSIDIPETVNSIGNNAFRGCCNLVSINIPEGVSSIGWNAFDNCKGLTSVTIGKGVTSIGDNAFINCSGLTAAELPNSVTSIGFRAFYGCSGLTTVGIPNSVTNIGNQVFNDCPNISTLYWDSDYKGEYGNMFPDANIKTLVYGDNVTNIGNLSVADYSSVTSLTIGKSVTNINPNFFRICKDLSSVTFHTSKVSNWFADNTKIKEVVFGEEVDAIGKDAFVGCTNLKSIILSDEITEISNSAFDPETSLLVKRGSKTLLSLWSAGYKEPKDINTSEVLAPTDIKFISSTQCAAKFHVDNIYSEYETTYDGTPLQGENIEFATLKPDCERNLILKVTLKDYSYKINLPYKTQSLNMRTTNALTATSFTSKGEYDEGDAEVIAERMEFDDNTAQGNEISAEGLEPSTDYEITYVATVRYGENGEFEEDYKYVASVRTNDLVFNTLPPKVVSKGEVIVAAESNLPNDELKVGFEWRRNDAPEELESKSCEAFLYNGMTEGILHNLTSFSYWRYRPYYESASGKRFYGGWGIVEADDDSYFEPTVHTYANIEVTDNTAQVNGYALNGTDEVLMLGFMYWRTYYGGGGVHNKAVAIPTDAKTVELDNKQQRMKATLTDLDYDSEYSCVAFVTTTDGKTFYGEEQKFCTGEAPTAIGTVESNNEPVVEVARYNMNGLLISSPQKGVNVIRYSDGTSKKVYLR